MSRLDEEAPSRSDEREDRALAAWEIVSVVSSVLVAEWAILSLAGGSRLLGAIPAALAFALMFASHLLRGESAHALGWRLDNFTRAVRLLVPPMLALTLLLLLVGWRAGSINVGRWKEGAVLSLLPYGVLWGLLQQYALQGFINRRAQEVCGRGWASVLVVALVFALLHLPNPWLTLLTFVGGLLWANIYQRAPNLIALGLSHAFMTWVLVSTVPPAALHSLRVGFNYFL